jgi:hypothetical protein
MFLKCLLGYQLRGSVSIDSVATWIDLFAHVRCILDAYLTAVFRTICFV